MDSMPNYARLDSGKLYIREYGSTAGFQPVGNVSALTLSPQTDDITLSDHTQPGGGTYAKVTRVTDIQLAYTFHDMHPDNLARVMRGSVGYSAAGSVSAEAVTAYSKGYIPLARYATAITTVTDSAAATTYDADDDYVLDNGMLYIPAGSGITDGSSIKVTYAAAASGKVEGFSVGQKNFEFLFVGQNEANSSQVARLTCHKVAGGVLEEMALIADDFAEGSVTSSLQADPSKYVAGSTKSQYFTYDVVGATSLAA